MNLQLFRYGIGRLTVLAFMFSFLGLAQAQVATHTQLNSAATGHDVTFIAKVSDSVGNPATDGTVSLENAKGASFGSAFVKDGEATLTLDEQPSGRIYAVYSGSSNFRSSTAQAQLSSDTTSSSLPDFTITANPTSLTLTPGQYGTIVLTITSLNGFDDMVTLSCSGNPAGSACIFSPTTVTPIPNSQGVISPVVSDLQITTTASSGASLAWPGRSSHTAYAIVLPGLLALVGLGAIRKRSGLNALSVLGLAVLLTASTLGLSACAQRYDYLHHPPAENPGVAPGSYTVTVAAYSNNGASVTSHTLTIALTVN
jgi:Bacterial Ig-like domain (group 3)